jgi:hypothetical protein
MRKGGGSKLSPVTSALEVRHLARSSDRSHDRSNARGEGDTVDRLGHTMMGKVSQLYAILTSYELYA